MADPIDAFRLTDPELRPVAEKVLHGARLDAADGLRLYATADLLGLGRLAEFANARRNGDRVLFSANQHINPTNVCVLRNTCVFCSFARMPKEEGAYTRSLEEVYHEAEQARGMPTREFHIVGGLHPKLRLSYYTDMLRGLKERHPQVHIKALTAVEIAHLARIERIERARRAAGAARGRAHEPSRRWGRGLQHRGAGHDRRAEAHGRGVDPRAPDRPRARHPDQLHDALRPRRDRGGPDRAPRDAARAAGRDRRLPHLHPARLPSGPQRARRRDGTGRHGDDRDTRTSRTSRSAGCSSTTSRTSRPTGRW